MSRPSQESSAGTRRRYVKVDMGVPILDPVRIPVNLAGEGPSLTIRLKPVADIQSHIRLSMGNPHAVIFLMRM